jgi:hypothetical protein
MALMSRISNSPPPPPAVARVLEHVLASMRDGKVFGDKSVVEDIKVEPRSQLSRDVKL